MSNIASWFRTKIEKELRNMACQHAELVWDTVKEFSKLVLEFSENGSISETQLEKVRNKEHEADVLRRKILRVLAEAKVKPEEKMYLARVVRQADWIADWALEATRLISVLVDVGVPHEVRKCMREMVERVLEAVEKTKLCVESMFTDPFKTLDFCDEVEKIEEEIDEMYREARREFVLSSFEKPSVAILVYHMLDAVEMMADKCEDTCDNIREYVVSQA